MFIPNSSDSNTVRADSSDLYAAPPSCTNQFHSASVGSYAASV